MKYLFLTYLDEQAWHGLSEPERQQMMAHVGPLVARLTASGKFLGGAPLHPTSTASTVRLCDGKRLVTDGPFAEAREAVGGYTLIDAQDRDEAIAIAGEFLGANGPAIIEVRALTEMEGIPAN